MTTTDELRSWIPAMNDVIYLNSGWSGPSTQDVLDVVRDVMEREAAVGPASVEGVRLARAQTAEALPVVASLLKADVNEVTITHGTTEGVNLVLYGTNWQPGDELVSCDLEHMAIMNATHVLEERFGVKVTRVETPANATKRQMIDLFDAAITNRTRIVAISHIQFSCGLVLPVREIAEIAHQRGATMLVDGAQTAGHINVDPRRIGADFYAISGQKWMCGPQATGAFYMSTEHQRDAEPPFMTHRIADERAEAGETAGAPHPLQRFRLASQSPALVAGFRRAVEIMQSVGPETIQTHSQALGDRLRAGVSSIPGCAISGPEGGEESSGLVAVKVEGWEPTQVVNALWDRWRIAARGVRYPAATRFSMASFNNEADADAVIDALRVITKETPPEMTGDGH